MRRVGSQFLRCVVVVLAVAVVGSALPAAASAEPFANLGSFGSPNGAAGGQLTFPRGLAVNRSGNGAPAGSVYVSEANENHRISQFTADGSFVRAWGYDVVRSGENNTGADEVQTLTVSATGGKFALSFGGQTTGGLTGNTSNWTSGSSTISLGTVTQGAFAVGQVVTSSNGTGIQSDTEIVSVSGSTLTLSKPLTANGVNRNLTGHDLAYNISADDLEAELDGLPTIGGAGGGVEVTGGPGDATGATPYVITFSDGSFAGNDVAQVTATNAALLGTPKTAVVATTVAGGGIETCEAASDPADVCKAAVSGPSAGQLGNPLGIAIDQSNGYLYVPSLNNGRVDVFSGSGQFAGAFGWNVAPDGSPGDTPSDQAEVCTTSCQTAGTAGGDAGRFGAFAVSVPAVDPSVPGRVLVPDPGNLRVAQYSTTIAGGVLTAATFDKAFGWDVIPGGAATLESCTTVTACQASQPTTGGNNPGQFTSGGSPSTVAVDSTGAIYVTSGPTSTGSCSAAAPCRIQKFAPDASSVTDFGPSSGPGQLTFTSGALNTVAAFNVAIDPGNDHVFVQRRTSATGYQVLEYDSNGTYLETHPQGDALTTVASNNQAPGLALGSADRVYALLGAGAASGQSRVFILGPLPPAEVTVPVCDLPTATTIACGGTVTVPSIPSGGVPTSYRFEYSTDGVSWSSYPTPDVSLGSTAGSYPVSQDIKGLAPNKLHQIRLCATTASTVCSPSAVITTDIAAPTVQEAFAFDATQTEITLGGRVNPENTATSYHFEWGSQPCSGAPTACTELPLANRPIGNGDDPVLVSERIDDLAPATMVHYRLVAVNSAGDETVGPDRQAWTLNECGLPNDRCFEQVSPADKGPVANAGEPSHQGTELRFQVKDSDEDPEIAYVMAYGMPDATTGGEVLYRGARSEESWMSSQLTPPSSVPSPNMGQGAFAAFFKAMAPSLDCAAVTSAQPLTTDAPTGTTDKGQGNLFRRNADGTYTVITKSVPTNIDLALTELPVMYLVKGISSDCRRVVFSTGFAYAEAPTATPVAGGSRFYQWDDGVLRSVGVIPDAAGDEVVTAATVGAASNTNAWGAVSNDGRRIFFSAVRQRGDGPAGLSEVGKQAVFVRQERVVGDASEWETVDVSQSETSVPNLGATYQVAARSDGRYVYFTANHGLKTAPVPSAWPTSCTGSTGAGCDLYRYDTETSTLEDVSRVTDPDDTTGAGVVGVLGASDDGSRVYFAARGQLVPRMGKTYAQNASAGSYNVYFYDGDDTRYVGALGASDITAPGDSSLTIRSTEVLANWTTRVTPDGGAIAYISRANVTGYDSGGNPMVYIYQADTGITRCVSCPVTGAPPSVVVDVRTLLPDGGSIANPLSRPRSLTDDGRRVFFITTVMLAPGATEGKKNLYQWEDGQVTFIAASEQANTVSLQLAGATPHGGDMFFTTNHSLVAGDTDGRMDVYDARIGGGLPGPPVEPECDVLDDQCQSDSDSPSLSGSVGSDTDRPSDNATTSPRASLTVKSLTGAQRARLAAGRRTSLAVQTNASGRVTVRGVARIGRFRVTVVNTSRTVSGAGRYLIPIRLSGAGRQRLAGGGALRVTLSVRQAGVRKATTRQIVLKRAKSGGRSVKRSANTDRGVAR